MSMPLWQGNKMSAVEQKTGSSGPGSSGPGSSGPGNSGRGLRIALAVSVALNLAVVGVVVGALVKHDGPAGRMEGRDLGFGAFTEALNPDQRATLRRGFIAKMPDLRAARQEMRADQKTLLASLRAEPFDPAALSAVLTSQSQRAAGQLAVGQGLLRDLLLSMDAEARHGFADRLEERLKKGRPDKSKP
jgi:uncharacterized membrane protein